MSVFAFGEYIVLGTFSTIGEKIFALCIYGLVVKIYTRRTGEVVVKELVYILEWTILYFCEETLYSPGK